MLLSISKEKKKTVSDILGYKPTDFKQSKMNPQRKVRGKEHQFTPISPVLYLSVEAS